MQSNNSSKQESKWQWGHTTLLVFIVVGTPVLIWWLLSPTPTLLGRVLTLTPYGELIALWWILTIALTLVAVIAGWGLTGRKLFGWLINEQYRMSLSRLQMLLWTIVVLASFATAVAMNVTNGHLDTALQVAIPSELWLVIGISTTSLVASPLILADKKRQPTNTGEAKRTLARMGVRVNDENSSASMRFADANSVAQEEKVEERFVGQVERNSSPEDASFADLFRGEQTSNADVLDVARLQNLFFTLILLIVYVAVMLQSFQKQVAFGGQINAFPPLDTAFVALLSISTMGYLAGKAVNYQPPEQQSS